MSFQTLVSFNQALLSKQAWWILKFPDSFTVRVLKNLYFPNPLLCRPPPNLLHLLFGTVLIGAVICLQMVFVGVLAMVPPSFLLHDKWIPKPFSFEVVVGASLPDNIMVCDLLSVTRGWNSDLIRAVSHRWMRRLS
ncbi:hypothetical protein ACOSQ3_018755 [Xanthoceras sorbifolium]